MAVVHSGRACRASKVRKLFEVHASIRQHTPCRQLLHGRGLCKELTASFYRFRRSGRLNGVTGILRGPKGLLLRDQHLHVSVPRGRR